MVRHGETMDPNAQFWQGQFRWSNIFAFAYSAVFSTLKPPLGVTIGLDLKEVILGLQRA